MDGGDWWAAVHGVAGSRARLSDFTFTFHFHALEKEMATHSSVLAWRIPGTGEPDELPSMGLHRVGHDWSDLAAAAAAAAEELGFCKLCGVARKSWGKKKVCCLPGTALGSGWIRHIRSLPWSRFSSSVEKQIISNSRNNFRFSRVLEKKNNKWDKYSVLYLAREGLPEVAPSELKPEIWNNQPGKRQWGAL